MEGEVARPGEEHDIRRGGRAIATRSRSRRIIHKDSGRRFGGCGGSSARRHRCAASDCRAPASRLLRLPLQSDPMAVVRPRGAGVMARRARRRTRPAGTELFRMADVLSANPDAEASMDGTRRERARHAALGLPTNASAGSAERRRAGRAHTVDPIRNCRGATVQGRRWCRSRWFEPIAMSMQ